MAHPTSAPLSVAHVQLQQSKVQLDLSYQHEAVLDLQKSDIPLNLPLKLTKEALVAGATLGFLLSGVNHVPKPGWWCKF